MLAQGVPQGRRTDRAEPTEPERAGLKANSKHIAGLLGPALVALAGSELMNGGDIWVGVSVPQVYLAGALAFMAGLSIVHAHNHWVRGWAVLVTLTGWFLLFGGLMRMIAPRLAQQASRNDSAAFALEAVLLAIGLVLTFEAYARQGSARR